MRTLLVPVDGSPPSVRAVEHVHETYPDDRIVLLTVVDPVDGFAGAEAAEGNWHESTERQAEAMLADHADSFGEDRTVETAVRTGSPAETILAAVSEFDADAVVVGSHGRRGIGRLLLGSVAETTAREASVPVTIV
jgi:nucleotide-binding universal stress UspA family protein